MVDVNNFLEEIKNLNQNQTNLYGNIFQLLGIKDLETKHSNFLAYLFDKKVNGNIGNDILYQYLKKIKIEKYLVDDQYRNYTLKEIFEKSLDIFVKRENNNIDILINFVGYVTILIENKIWTDEHDKQLVRYESIIKQQLISNEFLSKNIIKTPICIYLTPDGRNSNETNCENWIPCGYDIIYNILEHYCKSKTFLKLTDKQKILLKDYVELLKEYIMDKNKEEVTNILDVFYSDNEKKKLIENIIMYTPNYIKRAEIIKSECDKQNISILPGSANAYINIVPKEWQDVFVSKGLGKKFIYLQVSNNSSFPRIFIQCYFDFSSSDTETNKKWANKFYQEFNKKSKTLIDMSKDKSLGYCIDILTKNDEYNRTESQKQNIITRFFNNFYNNKEIQCLFNFIKEFKTE